MKHPLRLKQAFYLFAVNYHSQLCIALESEVNSSRGQHVTYEYGEGGTGFRDMPFVCHGENIQVSLSGYFLALDATH